MDPLQLNGNTFILTRGAVTYQFNCPQIQLELLADKRCYQDIPVKAAQSDKTAVWVDPVSHLVKKHSTPAPCSTHFPLVLQEEQLWLELPALRPVPAPSNQTLIHPSSTPDMIDLASGGLYTAEEVQAWEDLLSFPTYHMALLKSLTLGACIQANLCQEVNGQPAYDLSHMAVSPDWNTPITWFRRIVER